MRIGIDARLWNETGVGRYIKNLVTQLQNIDKENQYVLFLYQEKGKPLAPEIEKFQKQNPKWKYVNTDIRWHTLKEQITFPKIIAQEELDLMHFPYFSVPLFYKGNFVITIHDLIVSHFPTGKASTLPLPLYYVKHFAYNYIIKAAAKKAAKVLTVSESTKKEIIEHLVVPAEKVIVTYEGIDPAIHTKPESIDKKYEKYFLFVGNAYPHKNAEILLDIFEKITKEYHGVRLLFVGAKNFFYNRLEQKVKEKNLEKVIIFTGKVDDATLGGLYENAYALITPSLMEGFGLPGLEAMQRNCLVLASDIPVYREIYQDAAVYFNPRSEKQIHATIRSVLDHADQYASVKQKGHECIKKYSWQKMTEQTKEVYENCISLRQSE